MCVGAPIGMRLGGSAWRALCECQDFWALSDIPRVCAAAQSARRENSHRQAARCARSRRAPTDGAWLNEASGQKEGARECEVSDVCGIVTRQTGIRVKECI